MKILTVFASILFLLFPAKKVASDELECDYFKTIASSAWALRESRKSKPEIFDKLNIESGSMEEFLYNLFSGQADDMEYALSDIASSSQIYDQYNKVVEDLCKNGSLKDLYDAWNGKEETNEVSNTDTTRPSPSNFPKAGECSHTSSREEDHLIDSISWNGNKADIKAHLSEKIYKGTVSGLRRNWEGFRFSAFFDHDVLGPVEVLVVSDEVGGSVQYRQAAVSYKTTESGDRVIGSLQGFLIIDCNVEN
ncbi:hypothetical protein [uncultured Nitratireductor sp.]|uniref:hypothetical protein n=1 Tax=uncultured Nitratireductor sp. TaxID=520953 RepID=UPI0025E64DBC|nr:hypothetical protein [uncultured Nitratireductor sp.]